MGLLPHGSRPIIFSVSPDSTIWWTKPIDTVSVCLFLLVEVSLAAERSKVLQHAQLLASRGQYDAAIVEWKKLAADAPNDGGIHNSIGDLHLKRNAGAEATASFLQAAAAFKSEGATLKAIAAYKKVLKIDPTRYEVYRHLGDLNAERGLLSSAVQDYLTLGKHYLKAGKGKEALDIYKTIVEHDPANFDAQQRVAELCVQENLQDEATKVYLQLGRDRSAQGRYDEAKDAYLAVLRIEPSNREAQQFVESVDKGGTAPSRTVSSGTSSVQKSSESLDLLAEATRRIDQKQYAGAEAILNQLLTREPGNPQVCQLLARLHLQRGDVQVALGEYRFLAGAALRAQDYLLAESLIGEFLAAVPNSVPLLELSGELQEEQGHGAAAAQQYAKAVDLLIEHPEPGMETLHEELFEKVKVLSTDQELIGRLASKIRGEESPEKSTPAASASAPTIDGFSLAGAEPDGEFQSTASAQPQEAQEFSLKGAVPDDVIPLEETVSHHLTESSGQSAHAESSMPEGAIPFGENAHSNGSKPACDPTPLAGTGSDTAAVAPESPAAVSSIPPIDYEAHFTLGVAYKNMGLYEESKEEFEVSKRAESFYLDSCLMTALCFKEEQQGARAIAGLETVLTDPRCQGAKGQAIRYELGLLYEAEAQWEKAAKTYQAIPSFHDVPQRLLSLNSRCQGATAEFRLAG